MEPLHRRGPRAPGSEPVADDPTGGPLDRAADAPHRYARGLPLLSRGGRRGRRMGGTPPGRSLRASAGVPLQRTVAGYARPAHPLPGPARGPGARIADASSVPRAAVPAVLP